MLRHNKVGQSVLEYALVISVVVAALIGVNVYIQRGMQGRLKESADQIGRQFANSTGYQSAWRTTSTGTTNTTETRTAITGDTLSNVTTAETITRDENEQWGSRPALNY